MTISLLMMTLWLTSHAAQAGVFNIPEFVEYKSWAAGIEPAVTLSTYGNTESSGVSFTGKFTYGISPLSNLQIGLGTGSGSEGFRVGGTYTFDFIPDLQGQLGAGLALQAYYFKIKDGFGETDTTIYPYIHKMFAASAGYHYDPYLAMPFGLAFYNGSYRSIWQLVLGNYFKTSEHVGINLELGLSLKDTDTYLAGGVTYRD